jgi:tetratricopeptide (TPR) repeat protein
MLERRVRNTPDPDARYLSAVAHAGLGEVDGARRLFAEALAIDEGHIGARVGLALTDIQLQRYDEAAASLAVIEARRAACSEACGDAAALDRAARMISHFLNAPRTL